MNQWRDQIIPRDINASFHAFPLSRLQIYLARSPSSRPDHHAPTSQNLDHHTAPILSSAKHKSALRWLRRVRPPNRSSIEFVARIHRRNPVGGRSRSCT